MYVFSPLEGKKAAGKKAAAPRAAAPIVGAVVGNPPAAVGIPLQNESVNAEYFKTVLDAVESIKAHWPDITTAPALGVEGAMHDGTRLVGHQACLTAETYVEAMKSGEAMGGFSIFALDLLKSATPGIPINVAGVKGLSCQRFEKPRRFPAIVTIGVGDATRNIFNHIGALTSITPLELLHAMIFAVHRDIINLVEEEVLLQWRAALLSVPVHVKVFTESEQYFESISIREEIAGDYDAAYFTAYQRIYMIEKFRETEDAIKGPQTSEQLASSLGKVRFHTRSESANAAFVDSALTLYRRVLSIPTVSAVVKKADEDYAHSGPFSKVSALQAVMKKAGSMEQIVWTIMSIDDLFRNDMMDLGELTWDALTGYRSPGHKGTVDLLLFKKDLGDTRTQPRKTQLRETAAEGGEVEVSQ